MSTQPDHDAKENSGDTKPIPKGSLRLAAEARLALMPKRSPSEEYLHELQVYQIELEMQIEELQQSRNVLESLCDRYVNLYEFAPVGYITLNRHGMITDANQTGSTQLGAERKWLLNHRFSRFVAPEYGAQWDHHYLGVLKRDGRQSCELQIKRLDGTHFHAQITSLRADDPLSSSNLDDPKHQNDIRNTSTLLRIVITDITEHKRNEAELERHRDHLEKLVQNRTLALSIAKETAEDATHAKSHFLAAASHDMRQPLQAIRLFSDALAMTGLDEKQKRISCSLSKSVNSLSELLNELLDISRLDAGKIKPQPVVIQADDLLGVIAAEFDAVFREKDLSLNLFCSRQGLALFSDENLLLTLLRNLVSNAVKYTARGGVLISIRRRGDRALIQVWDTGIGIAPEQTDSIFEEYYQVGNPERDRAKGVGLGLSIVRRLGKLLNAGVCVCSREGKGSVFKLDVPLANESNAHATAIPASATPKTAAKARLAGKRIVIVEDDAKVAEALKLTFEMEGACVTLFDTAEDALKSAKTMGAHYYISDYRLPGMDGLQLLDAIQAKSAAPIKAVLLTGNTATGQISILQSARWEVLFKPVDLHNLLSAMEL